MCAYQSIVHAETDALLGRGGRPHRLCCRAPQGEPIQLSFDHALGLCVWANVESVVRGASVARRAVSEGEEQACLHF